MHFCTLNSYQKTERSRILLPGVRQARVDLTIHIRMSASSLIVIAVWLESTAVRTDSAVDFLDLGPSILIAVCHSVMLTRLTTTGWRFWMFELR